MSPQSCPQAPYCECVTLTSLRKSLPHLLSLPHWHGFPQASHPSVAALGWSPCTSQLVEGSLGWRATGSLRLLPQTKVALISWCSWPHDAALRFTNKQEASPLPPCWGWSPRLGAQLAQDSQGSFLAEVAGEFWGPTQGRLPSSLPLCAQLDSLPDEQRAAQVSAVGGTCSDKPHPGWGPFFLRF